MIAIIGAGAAGMMAAIAAGRAGGTVTLLEQNPKPGKKLLLTGNGRCNLTNPDPGLWERFHSSDPAALAACCAALRERMDTGRTLELFRELGLLTTRKDGCVYPLSNSARSVLHVLEAELARLGIKRKYAGRVTDLSFDKEGREWRIRTDTYTYAADRVILAAGSKACPETGSDGSGYELARRNGHKIVEVVPSLTGLRGSFPGMESAAGCRCLARVTARDPGSGETVSDTGQVQWNRDGISGVVVFQISGFVSERLAAGRMAQVTLDLLPETDPAEAELFLAGQLARSTSVTDVLRGILPEKLAALLGRRYRDGAGAGGAAAGMDPSEEAKRLARLLRNLEIPVRGVRGFDQAQVCRGGVALPLIDPETFESRIAPGLYFAGEILDADGPCGGYNLQWAWSTGYTAGVSAAG